MTDDLPPPPPPPPPGTYDETPNKGAGCAYGGLAVVVSAIGGSLLGGILSSMTDPSGLVGAISLLIPLALLIAAIVRWRTLPGFILGVGLTFAIVIVTFGACIAIITAAAGFQA